MPPAKKKTKKVAKRVMRYTHDDARDPRTPETGHTRLLPAEETVVTVPMDNGWVQGMVTGRLPDVDAAYVIDMDPSVDPVLLWSGKRNRREVPVLPLQRNELVTETRISQIIERARRNASTDEPAQGSFFADLEKELRESDKGKRVEFYVHDEQWHNKLICGDSLPVMESLIRYEGLAGTFQMIYVDPPYGIDYNANFQQRIDTTKNTKGDSADDVLTIKAFNDTWSLGVHSYLSYLEERLYLCRELLTSSGSCFVQCSDENVHRMRQLLDEVFGAENFVAQISFRTKIPLRNTLMAGICDYLCWYARDKGRVKYHKIYTDRPVGTGTQFTRVELLDGSRRSLEDEEREDTSLLPEGSKLYRLIDLNSSGLTESCVFEVEFEGRKFSPRAGHSWKTNPPGMQRLIEERRLEAPGESLQYVFYFDDFPHIEITNMWTDTQGATGKRYAVQTSEKVVERCIHMSTDPGDLVLDITCGSGVTALCSERWGRRWVTCDTSRVSVNVARQALLGAVFENYELLGASVSSGFAYDSSGKITLGSLTNDREAAELRVVDKPLIDKTAVRVVGPFEVNTLGRYSIEDWKGYLVSGEQEATKLENYVEVICRLYRPECEVGGGIGLLHALEDTADGLLAVSVGPLTGRVTAAQVHDAARAAKEIGASSLHLLGWAFEANVGEVKNSLDDVVNVQLIMIRPDALAEGLKVTHTEMLFSPLALPEVKLLNHAKRMYSVTLEGVGLFDRKTKVTAYHPADDGYIQAWYLDEDYDGDCFVDCQMFFDFKKAPNLKTVAGVEVDTAEYAMQFTSGEFARGHYGRVAVKVVDVYGNESTVVKPLP
ncbi:MAG: site-specific DNA-methyltransferase [Dehalococcoidia bacterium]